MNSLLRLIIPLHAGLFGAADPPVSVLHSACGRGQYEIAFVDAATRGDFRDATYQNRKLGPNSSICSDSKVIHATPGKAKTADRLVLRSLFREPIPPFDCKDLLFCKEPIGLEQVHFQVRSQLQGKSLWQSVQDFLRRGAAQTSTLPRNPLVYSSVPTRSFVMSAGIILSAGGDITADSLFPIGLPAGARLSLDICRNADVRDCGKIKPAPAPFPSSVVFKNLPAGLHMIWEATPLPGDTVPIRRENSAWIIAAHPSWTPERLGEARAVWSALMTERKASYTELTRMLIGLAAQLSRPMEP